MADDVGNDVDGLHYYFDVTLEMRPCYFIDAAADAFRRFRDRRWRVDDTVDNVALELGPLLFC